MKLFNKIAIASVGAAMAIGVGVISAKEATKAVDAAAPAGANTYTLVTADNFSTTLTTGDSIVIFNDTTDVGVTGYSGSDATVSGTEANWTKFTVTVTGTTFVAQDSNTSKYVSNNAANKFTIAANDAGSAAPCFVNADGVFSYTDSQSTARYLCANGTYYRCYKSIGSYSAFKVYKVSEGGGDANTLTGAKIDKVFATIQKGATTTVEMSPVPATADPVSYSYVTGDATIATVTSSGATATITAGTKVGSVAITGTATQNTTTFDKVCNVAVTEHEGSETDPLSVEDAVAICQATGKTATTGKYYVKGILTEWTANGTQYNGKIQSGDLSITIFKVNYKLTDPINIGDYVTLNAALVNYNGNTPESQYGDVTKVESGKTIDYIEINGTLALKTYSVGDTYDTTGLTVVAYYDDGTEDDVTASATFTVNPAVAALGHTQISIVATYNDVDSESAFFSVTVTAPVATATDVITAANLAATNTTYTVTEKTSVTTSAVYAAQSAKSSDGAIQIRSTNSNCGVVAVRTGGKRIKSVTITVNKGTNVLNIFASNTAYESPADLYNSDKQGTKVGSVTTTGSVNVVGNYKYVGVCSNSGAIYLDSIEIVYEQYSAAEIAAEIKTLAGGFNNNVATSECNAHYAYAKEIVLTLSAAELETFKTSTDADIAGARATYATWCARNADENPYEGDIVSAMKNTTVVDNVLNVAIISAVSAITLLGAALIVLKKRKLVK